MKNNYITSTKYSVEEALIRAGNGHQFQLRILIFVSLQYFLSGMLHMSVSQLFMRSPQNLTCIQSDSNNQIKCTKEEYCSSNMTNDPNEFGPITSEYGLACESTYLGTILIAAFFIGGSAGSLYYGEQMEYRQARFTVMLETLLFMGISCCASIFSPSLYLLSLAFFACNFFQRGFFNSSLILFFEISSENLQKLGPPILLSFRGVGEMLIPFIMGNFGLGWRQTMLIIIGAPVVGSSLFMKFMKESPRILVNRREFGKAKEVINHIAYINSRQLLLDHNIASPLPENWLFEEEVKVVQLKDKMAAIIHSEGNEIQSVSRTYNYSVLFKYNSTRIRTICLLYLYIVITFGQFLTGRELLYISKLGMMKTDMLLGMVETLGFLGSAYATLNNHRKEVVKYLLLVAAFFHFLIAIWPLLFLNKTTLEYMTTYDHLGYSLKFMVLVMCRLTMSFGFSFLIVYVLEVFPTSIRHYALSFLVFLTEFVFIFFDAYEQLCYSLGLNTALGVCVTLLLGLTTLQKLRETFDQPLKENLDEFQEELLNNQFYA